LRPVRQRKLIDGMLVDWGISIGRGEGKAQRRSTGGCRAERCLGNSLPWQAFAGKPREGYFLHDQLATGKKLRIQTVVDTHSRYCPAADARFTYRGEDVVQTLEGICRKTGYPKTIRVDNGSEFISRDLDLWAFANNVTLDFSRPGKPTDNGFIDAFNSKLRSECLNAHWFLTVADSREKLETWRRYYNEERLTRRSDITSRLTCIIPVAQPARHRDQSRKTPASGGLKFGPRARQAGL
jgi:putative transposase